MNNDSISYLTILGKYHQDCTSDYLYAHEYPGYSFYKFHWSMYRLTVTLCEKPYLKKLTNNKL